jgi:TnpA family transposase
LTSIERTAYPRFREHLTIEELTEGYTPTDEDLAFITHQARRPPQQLALLITLKCVQRLGYFPRLAEVPLAIQQFLCEQLQFPPDTLPLTEAERTRYRHHEAIRTFLGLYPYATHGLALVDAAVTQAAETMSAPADLINVALEQLRQAQVELPGFSRLDRRVGHLRQQVHQQLYQRVLAGLTEAECQQLDTLLVVTEEERASLFNRLKETPGSATLTNLRRWEVRLGWLRGLLDAQPLLSTLAHTKIKQFAAQAHALELSDLLDIADPAQRYTLLLCLLQDAQVTTCDQLTTMFLRRMRMIHRNAKTRLTKMREAYQELNERIISAFGEIAQYAEESDDDEELGGQVRRLLVVHGGAEQLAAHARLLSAYHQNNYLPLMWDCYRSHRALLFRLIPQLEIRSATQDTTVLEALAFVCTHQNTRGKHLPAALDLSFASQRWQHLIRAREKGEAVLKRQTLEVCVFHYLALGLSRGDLYVVGAEAYADYRQQLLSWEECEPRVPAYCEALELPTSASAFVQALKQQLTEVAERVDTAFPTNTDLGIDTEGRPHLKRTPPQGKPEGLDEFREQVQAKLPERHLLDILKAVHHWINYTTHFGPPSGSMPKMADAVAKYLVTIFGYGCNLGAAQTATHTRGVVTKRAMKRINDQHVSIPALEKATRDVINEYARFRLPFLWGSGKHAVADGTHVKLLANNLLGEHHFRYGEYGAIAYHHVSDTYIALFSHFIACGVWEAIYILDGLLKNDSAIQPDTIHADTQGQTQTVFGLAHLLGIQLMPRMRNWHSVTLCRPTATTRYQHIDTLFTETVNWALIEKHWPDLMQVVLSIQAGKVLPSMLLQKLGTHNRQNKLYQVFAEVGRVVRTIFLLNFLSSVELRQGIHTATTLIERYNGFLGWLSFGGDDVIRARDPVEQEKRIKYLNLVANAVMLHNVVDITNALQEMAREGQVVTKELVARISPYMTKHIKRFGEYILDMNLMPDPLQPDKPFLSEELHP